MFVINFHKQFHKLVRSVHSSEHMTRNRIIIFIRSMTDTNLIYFKVQTKLPLLNLLTSWRVAQINGEFQQTYFTLRLFTSAFRFTVHMLSSTIAVMSIKLTMPEINSQVNINQ